MDDFERELKQDFLAESEDFLEKSEEAFLRLESERENKDLINEIFRLAHNLKGTSKAVGFDQLAALTHVAENLILKLKEETLEASDAIVSALLEFKDQVGNIVAGLAEDFDAVFDTQEMEAKLAALAAGEEPVGTDESEIVSENETKEYNASEDGASQLTIDTTEPEGECNDSSFASVPSGDEFDSLAGESEQEDQGSSPELTAESNVESGDQTESSVLQESFLEEVATLENTSTANESASSPTESIMANETKEVVATPLTDVAPPLVEASEAKPASASPKAPSSNTGNNKKKSEDESIRVKLERIDELNNIVGEMVILQTVLSQRRFSFIQDDLANKSIAQLGKLFKETQALTMSLRMLPLKNTFQKMNRIVRDTSKALGKQVVLQLKGEETEVDKTVLERISDPLVHIIRNAVDHGLESSEDRIASGKSVEGIVTLKAYHEGSNLIIEITDDGNGIDPAIIRSKALEKGLIREGSGISDHEVIQLIFNPGFSTKEQVTEVSGRGVGMDVVKTNIELLGGEVKLESKVGVGSIFKISLPLTLAVIDGIIFSSGPEKFVVPLSQMHELTQIKKENIESFTGGADLIRLRGEVLPLFHMNSKLGQPTLKRDTDIIIIVRGLDHGFGVVVDDVINQQQIVIKKLGADIGNREGFMGSAIMGDGKPSFILDLFEIFKGEFKKSRGYEQLSQEQQVA